MGKLDYREMAYECLEEGENNDAIKYFIKAIEEGDALACIDMALEIKYISIDYDYTAKSLEAIQPSKFGYYLDLGIELGSLDCVFYKAREQFMGDGLIEFNTEEAKKAFIKLKELDYEPDYFDDDYSIDDYLNILKN